jgi:HTH-type transcriptional regulator/antitoxin HipB
MEQLANSPEILGSIIRHYRKSKKLSQSDLGELYLIQQKTISDLESGTGGTKIETLYRVLGALGLELVIRSKTDTVQDTNKDEW